MRLHGKTALVTGATSGIGAAVAQAFAQEGAQIVISGRSVERGEAMVEMIRAAFGTAFWVAADLTSLQGINHLIAETQKAVPQLDILVNNAGIFPIQETASIDEATFDAVMATNVKAPFFLTAAFAPEMVKRGSGKIINITTVLAHKGLAGGALYGGAKAALTLMTKAWAAEYGPGGVNVNAIVPHLVLTPGTGNNPALLEPVARELPAHRFAQPDEIAQAALYLASDDAAYVHGVTLPVDGGYLAI
jgi:NAD(P)-dependent dehydrogenase (short-subunit alcohol dehydrogenase family)